MVYREGDGIHGDPLASGCKVSMRGEKQNCIHGDSLASGDVILP